MSRRFVSCITLCSLLAAPTASRQQHHSRRFELLATEETDLALRVTSGIVYQDGSFLVSITRSLPEDLPEIDDTFIGSGTESSLIRYRDLQTASQTANFDAQQDCILDLQQTPSGFPINYSITLRSKAGYHVVHLRPPTPNQPQDVATCDASIAKFANLLYAYVTGPAKGTLICSSGKTGPCGLQ
jgi:hypothetical protein